MRFHKRLFPLLVSLPFCACSLPALANITVPNVLANHMVIQRDRPVHLWGMADPGEVVTVDFRDNHASTVTDTLGRWSLYLPPGEAGGPFPLTLHGKNTITWNDILVGDVWIASGQSNMEFMIAQTAWSNSGVFDWKNVLAAANVPNLRLLQIHKTYAMYPMADVASSGWSACTPTTAANFSAVGYFFAREIMDHEHVPVGIIEADWGGTPAESWTSLDALSADAGLMPVFAARAQSMDQEVTRTLQTQADERAAALAKEQGKTPPPIPWHPDPQSWAPAGLFNGMIAPLIPLPIRGVIWYQGESNTDASRAPIYQKLFTSMIQDWRTHWAQGNFPFLFVQIANFNSDDEWAQVREAQRKALSLPNTGMAVTIDIGNPDDVHPKDKQDVGHRLALWALDIAYGEHGEDSGPLFRQAVPENGKMHVWFDHAESGLDVHGKQLEGFEVAGADKKFVPAQAQVQGDSVVASSASVPNPKYVRYAWASNPTCNLFNHDGLPASPFSSIP